MTLQLHAKTYYNNPAIAGGDEHYVLVPSMKGRTLGSVEYQGTGWEVSRKYGSSQISNEMTPFGGYLHINVVLDNCTYPGMAGAELSLCCSLSYWGSPPDSGFTTVDWEATLSNSVYSVTRVTP